MIGPLHLAAGVTRNRVASLWCCCCDEKIVAGGGYVGGTSPGTTAGEPVSGKQELATGQVRRRREPLAPGNVPFFYPRPAAKPTIERRDFGATVTLPDAEPILVQGAAVADMTDDELFDFVFVLLATN